MNAKNPHVCRNSSDLMLHPAVSQLHQALPTLHMDFPTVTWQRCANGEETEWGMGQNHMVVHGEDIRVYIYTHIYIRTHIHIKYIYIYAIFFIIFLHCALYIIDIIWYNHQIRINSASKNNHSLIIKWTSNHRHDHVGLGLQTSHSNTWANKDRISKHIWTILPGESDQKRWYDTVMRHMRHMCRGQKHPTIPNKMVDEDPEATPFKWGNQIPTLRKAVVSGCGSFHLLSQWQNRLLETFIICQVWGCLG